MFWERILFPRLGFDEICGQSSECYNFNLNSGNKLNCGSLKILLDHFLHTFQLYLWNPISHF